MILKTFLTEKPPVACRTIPGFIFSTWGLLVQREQVLSHLCLKSYKASHALHMYFFAGNSVSSKKLYLLYNADTKHYSVITNIKAAMAKKYICNACDLYMTLHTNATKLAPSVLISPHVLKIKPSIVLHAIGGFSVRNVFRII